MAKLLHEIQYTAEGFTAEIQKSFCFRIVSQLPPYSHHRIYSPGKMKEGDFKGIANLQAPARQRTMINKTFRES